MPQSINTLFNKDLYDEQVINDIIHFATTKEISIKISNENIRDSIVINNVTVSLSKSLEFQQLNERLEELKDSYSYISEENVLKRLEISTKINHQIDFIRKFVHDILTLAEQFNRIEINTDRLRRAKEFFDKGEFGNARAVFEMELEQMQEENDNIVRQRKYYEEEILPKAQHNAEEFLIFALSTYSHYDNPNWFAEACQYFERSISSYPNRFNVFEYAYFLDRHNKFSEAEQYYRRVLNDFAKDISIADRTVPLSNLAVLHTRMNEVDEARVEYEELLAICRDLMKDNPSAYSTMLADALNNISGLHWRQMEYEQSLREIEEALAIRRHLADDSPSTYLPVVAQSLNNSGLLHWKTNEYEKALAEYEEAIVLYRDLAKHNPSNYLSKLSDTLNNIAILLDKENEPDRALVKYEESLAIRRNLAKDNPLMYLSAVATTLNNLANCHLHNDDYDEALAEYEEALKIRLNLAEVYPSTYLPDVAETLMNISIYYQDGVPNREMSIENALDAAAIALPICERVPSLQPYIKTVMDVMKKWGFSYDEFVAEIKKRINVVE